jgi:hypothetical protein
MRHLPVSVLCVAVLASGCDSNSFPTAPSPVTPRPAAPSLPPAIPRADVATDIALGEVVRGRVADDDPLCEPAWPHRCRYYRLTAPTSGVLNVAMAWGPQVLDPYPLDIDAVDEQRRMYFPSVGPGNQRQLWIAVTAGSTYLIGIWSFVWPAEEFELRTSIQPR